jgi:hypothetical protein
MSCSEKKTNLEIISSAILSGIPGGSGITKVKEHYYVIGDNSPFLYKLDGSFKVASKVKIFDNSHGVIPKHLKPDFEAMENINDEEIIVFGSGSKSPVRDIFLRVSLKDSIQVKSYSITEFYKKLKGLNELKGKELNIEAVAYLNDTLYLFNRKPNLIFIFSYKDFINHLDDSTFVPAVHTLTYKLPSINGIEAGFSGAATFKDFPRIYFTASVENTPNAYDDGAILGSFVGTIDITNNKLPGEIKYSQLTTPLPVKVESIAIENISTGGDMEFVLVTDSDGKESLIFKCQLKLE